MMYAIFLLVTLLALYICKIVFFHKNTGKKIPGPSLLRGLKIFLQGSRTYTLHLLVPQLAEEYGEMVQIDLFLQNIVFINDTQIFRKLVKDSKFRELTNDRPPTFFGKYYHYNKGISFTTPLGPVAQHRRKTFHNLLKFYGEGKLQFEVRMVGTLQNFVRKLSQNHSVDLHSALHSYIASLMGLLLDGDISHKAVHKRDTIIVYSLAAEKLIMFENESFLQAFPFLRLIPGLRFRRLHNDTTAAFKRLYDLFVDSARKTFDPNHKRGIVDEMLEIQMKEKESGGEVIMDDQTIMAMISDIAAPGFLTTSAALSSLFLFLIKNQDIQKRIYKEIHRVIGDTVPSFQHRHEMHYTEAVILETLRISGVIPFLLPHMTREDIVFDGYFIPKSTVLMMNAWYCHHRSDYWEDPYCFKPERFLDDEGQLLHADHPVRQKLIPFGVGRRGCPGETFGRSRAFLVTAFLVQKFQFLPPDNEALPSSDPRDWEGTTVIVPQKYRCKLIPRNVSSGTAEN